MRPPRPSSSNSVSSASSSSTTMSSTRHSSGEFDVLGRRMLPRRSSSVASSASAPSSISDFISVTSSPLSVQVLRFHSEGKQSSTLKKTRFVYEIETCHHTTGDVFHAERRFRDFKRLREALLTECRDCHDCRPFLHQLKQSKLPSRQLVVLDPQKYGASRVLELTNFLRDLVQLVSRHAHHCQKNGPDIDKSVGLFLGLTSLREAEDVVADTSHALMGVVKTRQDRLDYRAASMPDFRLSNETLLQLRARSRGYSDPMDLK